MPIKKVLKLTVGDVVLNDKTNKPEYTVLTEPQDRGDGSTCINTLSEDGGTIERSWLNKSIKDATVSVHRQKDTESVKRFHHRDTQAQKAARAGRAAEHQSKPRNRFYGPSGHKQEKANAKRKKAA